MLDYPSFLENVATVRTQIAQACRMAGRLTESVRLMPVTKNHPIEAPQYAHAAGLLSIGENRVQEAVEKQAAQGGTLADLRWELIGHLQSNKAKLALQHFARIQSVDSLDLAVRLNRIWAELSPEAAPFPILLEVNTGEDPRKFGFLADAVPSVLAHICAQCPALYVDGLMTVAPLEGGRAVAQKAFARLRALAEILRDETGLPLPELSMGMSGDLEEAIREGSTMVRVGTALFGERT